MPADFITAKDPTRRGFAISALTAQVNIFWTRLVRHAHDNIGTSNGVVPTCAGLQDIFEGIIGVITISVNGVSNFDNDILIRWKAHIKYGPRHFTPLRDGHGVRW